MSAELNVSRAARGASFSTVLDDTLIPLFKALFVPTACCLCIASYGWFARQEVRP
jgi:hypothetical protein